jgi:20S proteasome subunit beta 6
MNQLLNDFMQPKVISVQGQLSDNLPKINKVHGNDWSPYELNGGNIIGFVQDDFAVIAGDTRISRGFSILKRNSSKIHRLTKDTWICTGGMYADTINLWKLLDERIKLYELNLEKTPTSAAIAAMLSKILYEKRFFPFYTFNTLVGFGPDGKSELWSYDAIGSYDQFMYSSQGSANDMILPLLDNQFNPYNSIKKPAPHHPDQVVEILVDAFQSTAERDITCGDGVEVYVLKKGTVLMHKVFPLRSD